MPGMNYFDPIINYVDRFFKVKRVEYFDPIINSVQIFKVTGQKSTI